MEPSTLFSSACTLVFQGEQNGAPSSKELYRSVGRNLIETMDYSLVPESENFETAKKDTIGKGHLKGSRTAQISAL